MKNRFLPIFIIYTAIFSIATNCFAALSVDLSLLWFIVPMFLLVNILAVTSVKTRQKRLKVCYYGVISLTVFLASSAVSFIYHIAIFIISLFDDLSAYAWSALVAICLEAALFWVGIICVYLTSVQLGIKIRVVGVLCGMIPIANLIVLGKIIKTVYKEVEFEVGREQLDVLRRDERVCETKYPLLLVHGVFFRDSKYLNYWGRIPKALEINGATVYYGNHQSAESVADSAQELTERIKQIIAETGCEKLNIIAHSKGGLDCRYAIAHLGAEEYVASLTTVNSPHRGCQFADFLLGVMPEKVKNKLASTYNSTLRKLGDTSPDFLAAVNDLTAEACIARNNGLPLPQGIFCQSVGSKLNRAGNGRFPLNFTYHLAKYFDGANDGLVGEESFKWGENYIFLETSKPRGISHGDVVDLNRENLEGFDVREFYVGLVNALKDKGL